MHRYLKVIPAACLIASAGANAKSLDKFDVAKCNWGGGMAELTQGDFLAGKPLAQLLNELRQTKYPKAWMPETAVDIAQITYEGNSRETPSAMKAIYIDGCIQHELSK